MKVHILRNLTHGRLRAEPGDIVSIDDQTAKRWIDQGLAKEPKSPKPKAKVEENGDQ